MLIQMYFSFFNCSDALLLCSLIIHSYNVRWYVAPLYVQKVILFLLQRGSKTINLHLGGLFVLSLEFFATVKVKLYIACNIFMGYLLDSRNRPRKTYFILVNEGIDILFHRCVFHATVTRKYIIGQ